MQRAPARQQLSFDVPRPVAAAAACALLMGSVSWAVLSAGWVSQGGGGAVVVAMAAAIEAALLAQARVSRIVAALLIPLLCLAAIVPTTLSSMPYDGNTTLGHTVSRYIAAIAGGLTSSTDWTFVVGLCAVLWICGYWLGWLAMREHRGVLAVVPLYAVLATNVLNSKSPDSTALPEALSVLLTLVVIAGAQLDSLEAHWMRQRIPTLRGTRGRFAATVAAAAVLLTVAAVLLPPLSSVDISGRFFPGPNPGGNAASANGVGTIQFSTGTFPGGALVSKPETVLTYSVDTTSPVYLGVIADSQFVAGNWYPGQGSTTPGPAGAGLSFVGLQFGPGPLPRDLSSSDGAGTAATVTVHATIAAQTGATGSTAYALFSGEPGSLDHSGVAFGEVNGAQPQSLLTVDSVALQPPNSQPAVMHTTARISVATADQLRHARTSYPTFAAQYVALADDDTHQAGTIEQLAKQWTAGTSNPYDAAIAIETQLRGLPFEYTLTPPAPPTGVWPVVYFLTQSHRGYCQYFASAMGAMLRGLGIPARLINGYGPGTTQAQSGRPGQRQQVVTTSDAHTWVEAFFPGYGWIPFEPTPPSTDGAYLPFQRGAAAVAPATPVPSAGPSATPSDIKPGFNDPSGAGGASAKSLHGISPWVVLGLIAAAVLVLGLACVTWLLLPRSMRGAWRRVEVLGALRGARRRAGETHREYAARIASAAPRASPAMRELAALLGRAEFAAGAADSSMRRRATSLARRVVTGTPLTIWHKRRRPEPV